jgi:hypothetical protein
MDCVLCKTQPQQGELFLCRFCEALIIKAHSIQTELLIKAEDAKEEATTVKTEVVFFIAGV